MPLLVAALLAALAVGVAVPVIRCERLARREIARRAERSAAEAELLGAGEERRAALLRGAAGIARIARLKPRHARMLERLPRR